MTDPDQCIICLESLQSRPRVEATGPPESELDSTQPPKTAADESFVKVKVDPDESLVEIKPDPDENNLIATLVGCNHVVHDRCIRSWADNSNTCPICRTAFNEVSLSAELDGPPIDSYAVQDRKQTHEFDLRQWLQENPEDEPEEQESPCPICGTAERPDILLLCDACDAAYHTHCVGLNHVPSGSWYCMECADFFAPSRNVSDSEAVPAASTSHRRPFSRTRERQRRARRQARSAEWQGAWGQIAGRIFDATDIDLDNHEDDDALDAFRRSQQQREREAREYREWEQRLQIASRQGARDAFARNIPREIGERLEVVPVQETPEERRAWGALERAREADNATTPTRRKRKSRSTTASPREPLTEEPERKLKKPRTRRRPMQGEASGSGASAGPSGAGSAQAASPTSTTVPVPPHRPPPTNGDTSAAPEPQPTRNGAEPSFLSTLLKEVEMSTPSDDENIRNFFNPRNGVEPSSPVASPTSSSHNSPRALSLTPPPFPRPSSPSTLSSYVEPVYPKANYSPTRNSGETSDSEGRFRGGATEIRQPRPRRPGHGQRSPTQARSQNASPTRPEPRPEPRPASRPESRPEPKPESKPDTKPEAKAESKAEISLGDKERISGIVRAALKPHWRAQELTSDQYATINRDVSRKLYEGLRDPSALDKDARKTWEKIAAQEVSRALSELKV